MFDKNITTKHGICEYKIKTLIICFQHKLKKMPITKQARFILGIEDV
jgi:hypothetical protein